MKQKVSFLVFVCIGILAIIVIENVQPVSAATRPALQVQDVDTAGRQPFQLFLEWDNDPTQLGGGTSLTVPTGKRLVIEQVSATVGLSQGAAYALKIRTWVNKIYATQIFMMNQSPIVGGKYPATWLVDRLVRIYADPDTTVDIYIDNNLGGDGAGTCAISGYLLDVQ